MRAQRARHFRLIIIYLRRAVTGHGRVGGKIHATRDSIRSRQKLFLQKIDIGQR